MENQFEIYKDKCIEIQDYLNSMAINSIDQSPNSIHKFNQDNIHQLISNKISKERACLQSRLNEEFFGLGPLNDLLSDKQITEIIINGASNLWYERDGILARSKDTFLTQKTYELFLQRLYLELGHEPTIIHPFIDDCWRGNRIHIIGVYHKLNSHVQITIRKHNHQSWSLRELEKYNWINNNSELNFLTQLVMNKEKILIVGASGSGKTSVLKALMKECQSNERIIILEDSKELDPPNDSSSQLFTRFDTREVLPPLSLSNLVKQSLRMRPDRIVVGEVRGDEAKDLLLALSTGHKGSLCTLHASDPIQALIRLEMLIQMGAPNWNLNAIRKLILLSLNYIIVCLRNLDGQRKLGGIFKLISLEDSGIIIERVIV